jgi:hypothetical protein
MMLLFLVFFHASVTLLSEKRTPSTHWIGGWVSPKANLDMMTMTEIPSLYQESNLNHPEWWQQNNTSFTTTEISRNKI